MIDVTHDGHDGSARHEIGFVVGLFGHRFADVSTDVFGLEAELLGHEVDGLCVHALVDADHNTDTHTGTDDLRHGYAHHRGQLVGRHELGQFQNNHIRSYFSRKV